MKNLATPLSIFIFVFSSFTGELCSQPVRGNDRPIGRMFPEHAERRFLDPEYSFDEYFQLGSRRKVGPIKNGLKVGRGLGRAGQQRQPTSSRRARVVEESRTLTAEERSRADNGRLRAEEGRSLAVESRSRADNGRSRAEEGRCRADGVRVRLRGRGSVVDKRQTRAALGRSLTARQPLTDEKQTRDDERWTLADQRWVTVQGGEGQSRYGEGRSLAEERRHRADECVSLSRGGEELPQAL